MNGKNIILLLQGEGLLQLFSEHITYHYKTFPQKEGIHYLTL